MDNIIDINKYRNKINTNILIEKPDLVISRDKLVSMIIKEFMDRNRFLYYKSRGGKVDLAYLVGNHYKLDYDEHEFSSQLLPIVKECCLGKLKKNFDGSIIKEFNKEWDFVGKIFKKVSLKIKRTFRVISHKKFDKVFYEMNVGNGILNTKILELRDVTSDDLYVLSTSANFLGHDYEEPHEFCNFIKRMFEADHFMYESIMQILGYLFLRGKPLKKIIFILGVSNSGKSTLLNLLSDILELYSGNLTGSTFADKRRVDPSVRPGILDNLDKNMNSCNEFSERDTIDSCLVKNITGNDPLSYRYPKSPNMITDYMRGNIVCTTNELPLFSKVDDGAIHNRLIVLKANKPVSDEMYDPDYLTKLTKGDMKDRIFTHLIHYGHKYFEQNKSILIHESFKVGEKELLIHQGDPVLAFWENEVEVSHNFTYSYTAKDLYDCFKGFLYFSKIKKVVSFHAFCKKIKNISEMCPITNRMLYSNQTVRYKNIHIPKYHSLRDYYRVPTENKYAFLEDKYLNNRSTIGNRGYN